MASRLTRHLCAISLVSLVGASCAAPDQDAPSSSSDGSAARAIAEADIIQLDGGRLYALSQSGSLSVVDVALPGHLVLLGRTTLSGQPFEMYRRGERLVILSNGAAPEGNQAPRGRANFDRSAGAAVIVLDAHDPAQLTTLATLAVPGEIADSRIVGNVLYLGTYENAVCFRCGPAPRTMVTSFDVTNPAALRQVDQVAFESTAPDGYNLAWGSRWKRSIFATDQRLYIGGHANLAPADLQAGVAKEGIIDVLDISDPQGRLGIGARLSVAGALLSRWQIDEQGDILRVVSQRGAGRTSSGLAAPEVDTFWVDDARTFVPVGHLVMRLPRQEGLRSVRFDGPRAYAITYRQSDPLFVIDLSDPSHPVQKGELSMPGFLFHLEPHGDRLIGLGVDRTDPQGSLNVSLIDVGNAATPRLLGRVAFGPAHIGSDYKILNSELPEDQDRIQKAFRIFPDGLVVTPFAALRSASSPPSSPSSSPPEACANQGGGVQLVTWAGDTLSKGALLPLPGNPHRAFENQGEVITVSDSNVRSFSLASSPTTAEAARQTADLVIGTCVARDEAYPDRYPLACAAEPGSPPPASIGPLALLALAIAAGSRRGRRFFNRRIS